MLHYFISIASGRFLAMAARFRRRYLLAFAIAPFVVFGLSCGGSSGDSGAVDGDTSGAGSTSSSSPSSPSPDEPEEEDLATALLALLDEDSPLPSLPAGTNPAVGGTPYYGAAAAIRETLAASGVDVPELDIYVLPIGNTGESLLVLDAEESRSSGGSVPDDMTPAIAALLDSEALSKANVTQFAINFHGVDEQGSVTITMTMSLESLRGMTDKTLTEAELETAIQYGVTRP
jgi:hypothetical protein